jgi:3-isopropylmalate dehydratase, small subunit (EC 4.2.1.33)
LPEVCKDIYRNAFNIGLPLLESEEAGEELSEGEQVSVDLATGEIKNIDSGKTFYANSIPDFMRELIEAGGLVEYIKRSKIRP